MDHPLRSEKLKPLRSRMVQFLKESYSIHRDSNIIFVCGGNETTHMRRQFQKQFSDLLPEFEFFEPEFAMKSYFSMGDSQQFSITEFEKWIGELAHTIVLFPEAPGSFAETGYFAAIPELVEKTILALDQSKLENDSFITLGPAKIFNDDSIFAANIQFDYKEPNFEMICNRIRDRKPLKKTRRSLKLSKFKDASIFELFALTYELVSFLRLATIDDIEFFLRALFNGNIAPSKVKKIVSILVGSKRLREVGDFGHLSVSSDKTSFLQINDGRKTKHDVLNLELATALFQADPDFNDIMEMN